MDEIRVDDIQTIEKPMDSGEDMLLVQIDAFRAKAKQLQVLINAKEQKAKDLEELVREKEDKNVKLQEELTRKQEEADQLVKDVETQVDRMMQLVKINMDQLNGDIKKQVSDNQESAASQSRHLSDTLQTMSEGLESISRELADKTHSENVLLYRNIQDLVKEHDKSEEELQEAKAQYKSLKRFMISLTVLSVISIAVGACSLLSLFGII